MDCIRKTPSAHYASVVGDLLIFLCNIFFLPSCNSDTWRRYTLKCLCWCVEGKVGDLVQPGGASEDCLEVCFVGLLAGGNYVWCLVVVVISMGF